MKIRDGFVSNSSSSSFYCKICKCTYNGWGSEYEVKTSECGTHLFCSKHLVKNKKPLKTLVDKEWVDYRKRIMESPEDYEIDWDVEEKDLTNEDKANALEIYLSEGEGWVPAWLCPICMMEEEVYTGKISEPELSKIENFIKEHMGRKVDITTYNDLEELK